MMSVYQQHKNTICLPSVPRSWSARCLSSGYSYIQSLNCICGIEIRRSRNGFYNMELKFDVVDVRLYHKMMQFTIWAYTEYGELLFSYSRQRSLAKSRCVLAHESDQILQRAMAVFCRIDPIAKPKKPRYISDPNNVKANIHVVNSKHRLKIHENAFETGFLADCEICIRDRVFKVSKFMICLHSEVLNTAFTYNTVERATNRYVITSNFDPELVKQMLRYCYTGEVQNLPKIDIDLLRVADYFMMPSLIELCVNSIRDTINIEKLPKLRELLALLSGYSELNELANQVHYQKNKQITRCMTKSSRYRRMFEAFDSGRNYLNL